jgi:hypothetical protein
MEAEMHSLRSYEDEALWGRYFQTTKLHEVGFRALLMENGAEWLVLREPSEY